MLSWILILAEVAVVCVVYLLFRHEITTRAAKKADRASDYEEKREQDENARFLEERQLLPGDAVVIDSDDLVYYLDNKGNIVNKTVKDFRETIVALEKLVMPIPRVAILSCLVTSQAYWRFTCGSASWRLDSREGSPRTLIDHIGNELKVELGNDARQTEYLAEMLRIMTEYHTVREYAMSYLMQKADERIASTHGSFRSPALGVARNLLRNKNIKPFSEGHLPDTSLLVGTI